LGVTLNRKHAFVFALFRLGGGEQGAVVDVGRGDVAGEEGEIGFAAGTGFEQEETEGTEIFLPASVSSVCSC